MSSSGSSQDGYSSPITPEYSGFASPSDVNIQYAVSGRRRSPSPMGHLPYPEDVSPGMPHITDLHYHGANQICYATGEGQEAWSSWPHPPRTWNSYETSTFYGPHAGSPCPQQATSSHSRYTMESGRSRPVPATIPCPSSSEHSISTRRIRSPLPHEQSRRTTVPVTRLAPLIEDTPKKPLTLACLFCRKRKIACGSPPPGQKDRTCK